MNKVINIIISCIITLVLFSIASTSAQAKCSFEKITPDCISRLYSEDYDKFWDGYDPLYNGASICKNNTAMRGYLMLFSSRSTPSEVVMAMKNDLFKLLKENPDCMFDALLTFEWDLKWEIYDSFKRHKYTESADEIFEKYHNNEKYGVIYKEYIRVK